MNELVGKLKSFVSLFGIIVVCGLCEAVAVSGGRDSMALSVLAHKTMRNVVAMTVDHKYAKKETRTDKQ